MIGFLFANELCTWVAFSLLSWIKLGFSHHQFRNKSSRKPRFCTCSRACLQLQRKEIFWSFDIFFYFLLILSINQLKNYIVVWLFADFCHWSESVGFSKNCHAYHVLSRATLYHKNQFTTFHCPPHSLYFFFSPPMIATISNSLFLLSLFTLCSLNPLQNATEIVEKPKKRLYNPLVCYVETEGNVMIIWFTIWPVKKRYRSIVRSRLPREPAPRAMWTRRQVLSKNYCTF